MTRKLALLAGSFLVASLTSFAASAAPAVPSPGTPEASLVRNAQWGWGWRDRDYRYRDCAALALAISGATTLAPVQAASLAAPGLSTERLQMPVASKKKFKAKRCKKGKVYSKRRHKCVWKKNYRAKVVTPAKTVAPSKKK